MITCVKCQGKFHRLAMGTRTGSICRWCRESIAHERELKRVRRLPRDVREGKTRPLVDWPAKYAALAEDYARLTKALAHQRAEIKRLRDGLYRIATLEVAGETLEIKIAKEVLEERKP